MRHLLLPLLLLVLIAGAARAAGGNSDSGNDPAELERTWQAAWVFLPDTGPEGYRRVTIEALPEALAAHDAALPAVVYAHGCSGHFKASEVTGAFLARAGFLVVMPDSFARADKPASCIPAKRQGGLHRDVLGWRQAEVGKAIGELKAMAGVRPDAIFLMGLSEGGITTATYQGQPLAGRIVEGWTCHAGWPEYRGLNSPKDEPLLTLVAARDPWYRLPVLAGDCGAFMAGRSDARSLVVEDPPSLAVSHWLTKNTGIQAEVLTFLEQHVGD